MIYVQRELYKQIYIYYFKLFKGLVKKSVKKKELFYFLVRIKNCEIKNGNKK